MERNEGRFSVRGEECGEYSRDGRVTLIEASGWHGRHCGWASARSRVHASSVVVWRPSVREMGIGQRSGLPPVLELSKQKGLSSETKLDVVRVKQHYSGD